MRAPFGYYDAVGNRTYEMRETGSTIETYYEYDEANELAQSHEIPAGTWNYW